jgi:hypothetical protein
MCGASDDCKRVASSNAHVRRVSIYTLCEQCSAASGT